MFVSFFTAVRNNIVQMRMGIKNVDINIPLHFYTKFWRKQNVSQAFWISLTCKYCSGPQHLQLQQLFCEECTVQQLTSGEEKTHVVHHAKSWRMQATSPCYRSGHPYVSVSLQQGMVKNSNFCRTKEL